MYSYYYNVLLELRKVYKFFKVLLDFVQVHLIPARIKVSLATKLAFRNLIETIPLV